MITTKRHYVYVTIVVIECIIIGYILNMLRNHANILGVTSVSPLKKENYIQNDSTTLKYFYKPLPNTAEADVWPYLHEKVVNVTNSDGINTTNEYRIKKPDNTYRIIALGDSFTYGLHVNTQDSWPNQLERMLNQNKTCALHFEVINLGVAGYDIQYETELYRLRGKKYEPDMVIWLLIVNDFDDINELITPRSNILFQEMKAAGTLDPINPYAAPMETARTEMHKKYSSEQINAMQNDYVSSFNQLFTKTLLLSTFPFLHPDYKDRMRTWANNRPNSYYFDGLPDVTNPSLSLVDGHPNTLGHKEIAESIYKHVQQAHLTPCTLLINE